MGDIRKQSEEPIRDRREAMKEMREAMREKNDCLVEDAHCDNARKAILSSMSSSIRLDPTYFKAFFKGHQEFAANFNDYKYVERLCTMVCAIESWVTGPGAQAPAGSDDPYAEIAWIGGVNLHAHASMYFGFNRKEMLEVFQIANEMREYEIDATLTDDYHFPEIKLRDSEHWMMYFVAAITMKFREASKALDVRRTEFGISDDLRMDIINSIKATYWWKYMLMSRVIEFSAMGLPPEIMMKMELNEIAAGVKPSAKKPPQEEVDLEPA
ncbi:MAG: hypothetical protein OEX83_00055 [Gammaproteobacteria bacterium]|nr:hypothetical protein [Gammaproteobacteria bacterium]